MEMLHELEPKTYDRFTKRISGTSTFDHAFSESDIVPRTLPIAFKDWKEYRDYLLIHITKPEYWDLFRKRWAKQNDEQWYKIHVKEIIINDIDGTVNQNAAYQRDSKTRLEGKYKDKRNAQFKEYMESKND